MTIVKRKSASNQEKNIDVNSNLTEISLKKIHDAIPPRLLERSTLKSFLYLGHDLILVLITFSFTYYLVNNLLPNFLFWPVIVAYWLVQGTIATGIWVIAHECGHQAFSPSQTINDAVGLILHSSLLTPYHSWKISHGKHHRSTCHMSRDMVFVPVTRSEYLAERESLLSIFTHSLKVLTGNGVQKDEDKCMESRPADNENENNEYLTDIPLLAFFVHIPHIVTKLFFGWHAYLLFNITGQKYDRWASHFNPKSPIFDETHKKEVTISNIGLITMLTVIFVSAYIFSAKSVIIYYFMPYLIVNVWLVLITYLHHTDPIIPHYRDGSWTYVRGALATVDRDYGFILNYLHHHIADTHVAHHLFSKIPHYNATEVTKIIKPLLGDHYKSDNTFFLKALWNNHLTCQFVPDEGDVVYYERAEK